MALALANVSNCQPCYIDDAFFWANQSIRFDERCRYLLRIVGEET